MINVDSLKGIEFVHGRHDCYELMRDFYREFAQIELTPYARPEDWWHHGLDLYPSLMAKEGFKLIDYSPTEVKVGDIFLMSFDAHVANHAGIYIGSGHILHHLIGRLSSVTLYKGPFRNNTVAVYRHPLCPDLVKVEKVDLMDLLPFSVKVRLDAGSTPPVPH